MVDAIRGELRVISQPLFSILEETSERCPLGVKFENLRVAFCLAEFAGVVDEAGKPFEGFKSVCQLGLNLDIEDGEGIAQIVNVECAALLFGRDVNPADWEAAS